MDYLRKNKSALGALFIVIIDYIICIVTSPMTFHTNDDFIIDFALSKAQFGEIWWFPTFIDAKLGYAIGILYLLKNISWWFYFQHLLIVISIYLINYSLLGCMLDKKITMKFSMGIVFLLNVCLFWRWISYVAFTMTPAICIASIISIVLSKLSFKVYQKRLALMIFVLFIFYYIALMIRSDSAIAGLPFLLLAFSIKSTEDRLFSVKSWCKVAVIALIFSVTTFFSIQLGYTMLEKINGTEYLEFNNARIAYTDYYHDSYSKNPSMYETIHWDEEMVGLVWNFCMEEKGTSELVYVKEHSEKQSRRARVISSLQDIAGDRNSCLLMLSAIGISFLGAISILTNKKYGYLLYYVLNNIGAGLLILYLLIQGRVNLRSINVVILPLCVINIFMFVWAIKTDNNKCSRHSSVLLIVLLMLLLVCSVLSEERLQHANEIYAQNEAEHLIWAKYVNEHPNDIFIEETGRGAAHTTPRGRIDVKNNNYSNTGDADWNCASRKHFCINNNFENGFLPYIFEKENVYYVTKVDAGIVPPYILYMMEHHQAIGFAIVDRLEAIDRLCVIHLVYDFNKTAYEEYYTIENDELVMVTNI